MKRRVFCQSIQRLIYGGIPSDDASISLNQINLLANQGLALAVKSNYTDNLKLEGIGYVNNSFYTTYKNLPIERNDVESFCYSVDLPETPAALGRNDGMNSMRLKDGNNYSITGVPLTLDQWAYKDRLRQIPNRFYYTYEGKTGYVSSVLNLAPYTATVRMVSGTSDSTDLDSEIPLADEWLGFIQDYVLKLLLMERSQPLELTNDGYDLKG